MCIHINTIEFVMKINDSVKGVLTSRANCPLLHFAAQLSRFTTEPGYLEPTQLLSLALGFELMLKTTTILYIDKMRNSKTLFSDSTPSHLYY